MNPRDIRKSEIKKAMGLIGWGYVYAKLKTIEDKAIYKEIIKEIHDKNVKQANKTLKKAGINL